MLREPSEHPSESLHTHSLASSAATGPEGDMIVMHSMRDYDAERAAGRMAVQAAAGALISITGQACNDIVMCAAPREGDDTLQVGPSGQGPFLKHAVHTWHVGGSPDTDKGSVRPAPG